MSPVSLAALKPYLQVTFSNFKLPYFKFRPCKQLLNIHSEQMFQTKKAALSEKSEVNYSQPSQNIWEKS